MAGGGAHDAAEGFAEGAFGFVAQGGGDGGEAVGGVFETVGAEEHAPAGEVFHGGGADDFAEAESEDGAGHADALGEGLQGPGVAGVVVDGGDGEAHLLVGEGGEPAGGGGGGVGEMEAEGLDEHHVGELLRDEGAAGLGAAELFAHALEGPAHGGLVGLALDVDDGRERLQDHVGVAAGEGEVAAGDVGGGEIVAGGVAEDVGAGEGFGVEDGFEGGVGGEAEGKAAGEEEAVAGVEEDWVGDGVDDEPGLAGEHGVTLDAGMLGEVDGDVVEDGEASGGVEGGLHEGEDFGEGVHARGGRLVYGGWRGMVRRLEGGFGDWDDWTDHTDF